MLNRPLLHEDLAARYSVQRMKDLKQAPSCSQWLCILLDNFYINYLEIASANAARLADSKYIKTQL